MSAFLCIRLYLRVVMFLLLYFMAESLNGRAWLFAMRTRFELHWNELSPLGAVNEALVQPVLQLSV